MEDLDVNAIIILKPTLKKINWESVSWIILAKNTDEWTAVVNRVMKLHIPLIEGNVFTISRNSFSVRTLLYTVSLVI